MRKYVLIAALVLAPFLSPAVARGPSTASAADIQRCALIVYSREIRDEHPTSKHWQEPPCRDIPADAVDAVYMTMTQYMIRF